MHYLILVFDSTHHVLKAEKIFLSLGIAHDIIPTPKNISSDCGMSIRIDPARSDIQTILAPLKDQNLHFSITEIHTS